MFNPVLNPTGRQIDTTKMLNNYTFLDFYKRLRLLALSVFKWENLPESMNERFLEKCLYYQGIACFVHDEKLGFLNLRCLPSEQLNVYEEALKYTAFSINYNKTFDRDNIVLVRNNYEQLPTDTTIQLFARRLFEAERTTDVNIKAQKTPVLIKCPEKQRLTLKNLYSQYDGNSPFIFGDKDLDVSEFTVLNTNAPFVADKLAEYKRNIWNEALTFLGINNVETEKNERLVTDEVNANNNMIQLAAETMLLTRKQAAEEFNKKYGFNVSVSVRSFKELPDNFNEKEVANNGEIYD
jgi:hypothetical protein|nr:MAG TPA: upper collar protein [Caudoviricetes sp.]